MYENFALVHVTVAEIMHEMHSARVPTLVLAALKLVKSPNTYRMCTKCVVHQDLKAKVVSAQQRSFNMALAHVDVTMLLKSCILVVFLYRFKEFSSL